MTVHALDHFLRRSYISGDLPDRYAFLEKPRNAGVAQDMRCNSRMRNALNFTCLPSTKSGMPGTEAGIACRRRKGMAHVA